MHGPHKPMSYRNSLGAVLGLNLLLLVPALALVPPPAPPARAARPARAPVLPRPAAPARPAQLHLQWAIQPPPPRPAWPDQPRMPFDAVHRPVAAGDLVLLASARTDSVTALDAATGAVRWRFTADGPVRFAPAIWRDRAFVVSDDGHLYCLDRKTGRLLWKFRGGPTDRRILGNERLISTWPARGAPAVAEDGGKATVYFAAGIWPFMGVFLHALDARSGAVRWTNSGDGSRFMKQPHTTDAFAGVAPQGALIVAGDYLLVPGGRSVPACYDRRTGQLVYYRLHDNGKIGGPEVQADGLVFLNGGSAFDVKTGTRLGAVGGLAALGGNVLYSVHGAEARAFDLSGADLAPSTGKKLRNKVRIGSAWLPEPQARVAVPPVTAIVVAEGRLYLGGNGQVLGARLPLGKSKPDVHANFEGSAAHVQPAGKRLLVSTREGQVYCFGPEKVAPRRHALPGPASGQPTAWAGKAADVLAATGVRAGYAVAWGVGSGNLVLELARQSELRLIVVEADPQRVAAFRTRLDAAGLDAERVAVLPASPGSAHLPPYLCSLMVSEGAPLDGAFLRVAFAALRPFGGVACFPVAPEQRAALGQVVASSPELARARLRERGGLVLLARDGPLPGSGDWTHEHADAANTRVSRDALVKAPLGLLWFGGPGNDFVLPRHGHGPQPQVLDGRLFIEGAHGLRALDVYTGRLLWQKHLPGLGDKYNNLAHQPGANAAGSNYVSTRDGIFVAHNNACVGLDPATGRQTGRFALPPMPGEEGPPRWDYLTVSGPYLIGGASPRALPERKGRARVVASSARLTAIDRRTGKVLWNSTADEGYRHNALCIGGGRLYAIDRATVGLSGKPKKQADEDDLPARLLALDLRTGEMAWSTRRSVFGTWLSYSEEHDVLLEAGRVARDTLIDEPRGMRAYQGASGKAIWHRPEYIGPAVVRGRQVLKSGDGSAGTGSACDLLTGAPQMRIDPITGDQHAWSWRRTYGCDTPAASQHLLTFRSGAAGYFDLCNDGGTGNLGGFRSSCTNNLIVAGGVLTAPDYTRTCTCSYQNQTSLALVPMADAEMWTYYGKRAVKGRVKRIGINLGAPGNRLAENGTLWLEHPTAGGPSPTLAVRTVPARPEYFRMHSSLVEGEGLKWVGASGARGLRSLAIPLGNKGERERTYTVRLYFLEPDRLGAGERRFDVALQGDTVLRGLDVSKEAGGPNRALVKEIEGVRAGTELTVTLTPDATTRAATLLSGVEVVAEGW